METTNNLPSLFRSLRTSCHSPLISTAELERLILHDKALENDTKGYREAINIDRNEARNKKRRLPAICPSIQFRRTGRKLEDFGCATGWLMLDYDHVAEIVLDEKVELASKSPYSMVVYRTSAERDYASSYATNGPRDAPSPSPNCTISPSTKPSPSTTTCCTSRPTNSARTW